MNTDREMDGLKTNEALHNEKSTHIHAHMRTKEDKWYDFILQAEQAVAETGEYWEASSKKLADH